MNKSVFTACLFAGASAVDLSLVNSPISDKEFAEAACEAEKSMAQTGSWHTKFKVKEKSHKLDPKVL